MIDLYRSQNHQKQIKKAIENLIKKYFDAKEVGVEEWEAQIDDIIAHLYGLSKEEMKIIRGSKESC